MNLRSFLASALVATILLSLAACSSDDDDATSTPPLVEREIDAGGGTIDLADDAVTLEFPAGALAAPTTITVREASRAPADVIGRAFEFGPSGTQFATPVTFTFDFVAGDLADGTLPHELTLLTWNGSVWEEVDGALVEAAGSATDGTLSVPLDHFSTYAVARVDGVNTFYGTFGFAADDVFAYGRETTGNGRIARWDGTAISTVNTIGNGRFFDGWGPSPTEHYALAYDGAGRILRSPDGTTWTEETTSSEALLSIHGSGAWRIAVGYGQTILENDGTGWIAATGVPNVPAFSVPRPLHAVVMTGAGDAFVGGDDVLYQRSGGAWSLVDLSALLPARFTVRGLWARAANDVIAVGWETDPTTSPYRTPMILRYDGSAWSVERPPVGTAELLNGVWGATSTVFATGQRGTLIEEAPFFVRRNVDTTANLYDVWALDDTTIAFVGAQGSFYYPGYKDPGNGGGTGSCTGTPTYDLDLRASQGNMQTIACGATRVVQGIPMSLRGATLAEVGINTGCVLGGQPCVDSLDGTGRGGGDTYLFFEDCAVLSFDLSGESRSVGCVEVDVVDFCSVEFCDGGIDSRTVAFLYDAQGNILDQQGTLTGGNQTLTLDGSSGRAARVDVRFTYGGLEAVRLFY